MEHAIICDYICDSVLNIDSDSMAILFRKLYITIFQKRKINRAKRVRDASNARRYQSEGLSLNQKQNIESGHDRNHIADCMQMRYVFSLS